MVTEGGMIGKIGFNSAGLGLCFNALLTDQKSNEIPIHLALRAVLNSYTLSEALAKVKDGKIAASASFIIGSVDPSGDGLALNVEVYSFAIDLVCLESSSLITT